MKTRLSLLLACLSILTLSTLAVAQSRRGPFTTSPRSVRSRDVDQQHIRLDLHFNWERREMKGRATHTLVPFKPLRRIVLDAAEMKIESVAIAGDGKIKKDRPLQFKTFSNRLEITLHREYRAGEELMLVIDYVVTKPRRGAHFVVPDESEPSQPQMVWTQSEPEYARYWFPCVDTPSDRLTSEIIATVPKKYYVLSNGKLKGKKDNGDGTTTWHWQQKQLHVPYLMSVVAGEFEVLEQSWDGIPVLSYVPKGRLADAKRSFEKTPAMLKFFSQKIGVRYPWPKYAQICVDEYGWGGMEHTSATTLNIGTLHDERAHLDVSSDGLVAHELAHQWFGDLMTCKDWGELWLNESFATYFATLWREHDLGDDEAAWARWGEAESYQKEDKRYRRSIVNYRYNAPGNMFDRHSYPKGARVLHMLRFVLGDELFWKSIHRYTTVNRFRTVETADLRRAIEDATGQGLNWFFDQWVHHGGHPDYEVDWAWDEETKNVRLTVRQTQKVDDVTPLFRMPVEIELAGPNETLIRRVTVSKAAETFHFALSQRPTRVCFDPRDWILKTLKASKSKEEWLDQIERSPHVICRVRAVKSLADFLAHEDARAALRRAAQYDAFWAVRMEAVKVLAKTSGKETRAALLKAAAADTKSMVRREAIKALGNFAHDDTRKLLRKTVSDDPSYYAAAEALRTLAKVDKQNCAVDLRAALNSPSHREVILSAACDELVKLRDGQAAAMLGELLKGPLTPQRRVVIVGALGRLKPDDEQVLDQLEKLLDDDRRNVRRSVVSALAEIDNPRSRKLLQARRSKEEHPRAIHAIDEALKKLAGRRSDLSQLRKQLDELRKQNQQLQDRVKKLEKHGKK
ncbi:MAG: HEAT repeat domain-containing protein [Planctomycetes bacterium]|nr:HEAT repeat domain-containing protein [Planctomycetota bacterium]